MRKSFSCSCGNQIVFPEQTSEDLPVESLVCQECGMEHSIEVEKHPSVDEPVRSDTDVEMKLELDLETEADTRSESESESDSTPRLNSWNELNAAAPRRRRKEGSLFKKIVPPVLGGLAAFPIATAIMWYGLGRDIGTVGPFVAQYAPWIVPKKLQTNHRQASFESKTRRAIAGTRATRLTLPTLNRNSGAITDSSVESNDLSSSVSTTESPQATTSQILNSIRTLKKLQSDLYHVPKDEKMKMIGDYYVSAKKLSEQTFSYRGKSASPWKKELEGFTNEVLDDKNARLVLQYGPIGKLPGIDEAVDQEFVATVLEMALADIPDTDNRRFIEVSWKLGNKDVAVELLPDAWVTRSWTVPTACFVLGRLTKGDTSSSLKLQIHVAIPRKSDPQN